jgi:PIN domain nuclease of toxin-antitoxin system
VSFWEISVKSNLGKLSLPLPPERFVSLQRELHGIDSMALDEKAGAEPGTLPGLHRDPFGRMLICQARAHGLTLASSDPVVRQYPVLLP